jgi:hypothetical protein
VDDTCAGVVRFTGASTGLTPDLASVQIFPTSVDPGDTILSIYMDASHMLIVDDEGNLTASGVMQAGTILVPSTYNRIGGGTPQGYQMASSSDLLVSDDLEVGDDVNIFGTISWAEKTSYLSIPGGAFNPFANGYSYYLGTAVQNQGASTQYWVAPVELPHGATVTKVTTYVYDNAAGNIDVDLWRTNASGVADTVMAETEVTGTPGFGSDSDTTIGLGTINNQSYYYYLWVTLPGTHGVNLLLHSVVIEYKTTGPH